MDKISSKEPPKVDLGLTRAESALSSAKKPIGQFLMISCLLRCSSLLSCNTLPFSVLSIKSTYIYILEKKNYTKPRASMPTLKKSSSANTLTVCESRAAIKLQSVVLRRTVSLASISSDFRRVASSDFLSRTSSVVSASSNTTSVMMSVLQGAKIHTLSACQSADTLMPSNLPLSVALTGKVASLLPTVPDSVWEAGKDAKESNKSAGKSTSADTGAKYLCNDSDVTVHGWSQEDDPKRPSRSKLSCLKIIALRLCFARNKSDADNS